MPVAYGLEGVPVLVTGAASGIGRSIAETFAAVGAKVAVNHLRRPDDATAVANRIRSDGGTTLVLEADVTLTAQVAAMVAKTEHGLGLLEILVNCAGVIQEKPFLETTEADWDFVVGIDLKGVFQCCRAALPGMVARGSGVVINIASELGFLGRAQYAPPQYAPYCAAKAGMIGLTRSLAREFAPRIRINGIAPGPIDTEMLSSAYMSEAVLAKELEIPAGRFGRPGARCVPSLDVVTPACLRSAPPNGGPAPLRSGGRWTFPVL